MLMVMFMLMYIVEMLRLQLLVECTSLCIIYISMFDMRRYLEGTFAYLLPFRHLRFHATNG